MLRSERVHDRAVAVAVAGAPFFVFLVYPLPIPLIPSMARDLGVGVADLQLVLGGYPLGLGAALLAGGALSDRIGAGRAWIASMVVFALCAFGCASAPSAGVLIGWRVGQGLAGAVLLACSLSLIVTSVRPAARPRLTAYWGAAISLGLSFGPLAGALSVELGQWRPALAVPGLLALGAAAAGAVTLPTVAVADPPRRLDLPGTVTLALGLGALILCINRATTPGAGGLALGLLATAAVLLAGFVLSQRRNPQPMVEVGLFRERGYLAGVVAGAALAGSILSLIVVYGSFLQEVVDLSPLSTALWLLPRSVIAFVVALWAARLNRVLTIRIRLAAGLAFCAAGLAALLVVDAGSPAVLVLPGFLISGIGVGLVNPALAAAAVAGIPAARSGMAAGAANTARQLGNAVGIAVLAAIAQLVAGYQAGGAPGGAAATAAISRGDLPGALALAPPGQESAIRALYDGAQTDGIHVSLLVSVVIALVGVVAVLWLTRDRTRRLEQVSGGAGSARSR